MSNFDIKNIEFVEYTIPELKTSQFQAKLKKITKSGKIYHLVDCKDDYLELYNINVIEEDFKKIMGSFNGNGSVINQPNQFTYYNSRQEFDKIFDKIKETIGKLSNKDVKNYFLERAYFDMTEKRKRLFSYLFSRIGGDIWEQDFNFEDYFDEKWNELKDYALSEKLSPSISKDKSKKESTTARAYYYYILEKYGEFERPTNFKTELVKLGQKHGFGKGESFYKAFRDLKESTLNNNTIRETVLMLESYFKEVSKEKIRDAIKYAQGKIKG